MNSSKQITREEIKPEHKWNIQAMYTDDSELLKDIDDAIKEASEVEKMQSHVMDSPQSLQESLDKYASTLRLIENAYVYSHMKRDEDNANTKSSELYGKAVSALTEINAKTSFLIPEILSAKYDKVVQYLSENNKLEEYRFMLEKIFSQKAHSLSAEEEFILSSLGETLQASDEIFSVLNDADMVFSEVVDNNCTTLPLTHASFSHLMESKSRDLRKDTYYKFYSEYKKFNNTISTIYNYNVKKDTAMAGLRKYSSSLEAALEPGGIPITVYNNLIDAVHRFLPSMHKYVGIRKKVLGIEDLKMYDVYTPLVTPKETEYTFQEAVEIVLKALSPLGKDYCDSLKNGLLNEKWVDIYENKGKTSGAYSFGSYDSFPYILMNYTGKLKDVFTLVHESGHSMHSLYTRKTQPYIYGDHSIFTAETASTVNEILLIRYLLEQAKSDQEKAYLINFYMEGFKGTLFRQTMFAEFEKTVHGYVESGESLTADYLNETYNRLNKEYFGPHMSDDDMIQYEWSRIPHFYRSFYVYQYATGYSAANAIVNRILDEGEPARDDYLKFLSTGNSDYPIDLLKVAGVDMSTEAPVVSALSTFSDMTDELEKLLKG